MDQVATWYRGRPWTRPHCGRCGPSSPPSKNGAHPAIFGPCLLWPNGWMDQDSTWHVGRPRPRPHCAGRGPSFPPQQKGQPQFLVHECCGQTAGWIKIPFGTKVGLDPGHIVLHAGAAPPKGAQPPPNFRPMSIVAAVTLATAELLLQHFPRLTLIFDIDL